MYELVQVGERTYYIDCPVKMGIFLLDDCHACLIDGGSGKDAAKKALKLLTAQGWELACVINTHSHGDHIGGNHLLQSRTGCKIFAKEIEQAFTQAPVLEPAFLFGGFPPKALRNHFLEAAPSNALPLTDPAFPQALEVIDLPGHCFDMIGLRTPDDIVFLADALASEETMQKYQLSFLYDVEAYLATLQKIENMQAKLFLPSHAAATPEIAPLARLNREKTLQIAGTLLTLCESPHTFEELLQAVFSHYALQMDWNQFVLIGSTVRSYLAYLYNRQEVTTRFEENRMLWERA
ncbi:MAG TPA: MBL fold metallo-hydrolase [Candidatus Fimivicinus intestinavium]|nr:MBL fold metallo-hydrolase [Candidatus Fimivicinus intestinavium]